MSPPAIVSYQRLRDALSVNLESTARQAYLESAADVEISEVEIAAQLSHALQVLEAEGGPEDVMVSPRDEIASLLQTFLARESAKHEKIEPLAAGGYEAKFDHHDILGWAGSFFRWWKKLKPHEFIDWDGKADRLPNQARVAVLSDWGSGLYGAPECAKAIEGDKKGFDLVLHLGDVYYAGDDDEIRERFMKFWPQVENSLSRALNGNHEMYTGGQAYFKIALAGFNQPSSFCALENDHWILAGLDTAYKDHRLHGDQAVWLKQLLDRAGDRRVILFSHHQPYSIVDALRRKSPDKGRHLVLDLADFLKERQIFAWYWGHEHQCVIYDDHPLWGLKGRCVGHSGFPEFRPRLDLLEDVPATPTFRRLPTHNLVPGGLILDGPNRFIPGHEKKYVPHGFVVLEFDDDRIVEFYYDAGGQLLMDREVG